jgi:protein-S-isoprenylcysteine O-methyltransferase Ste14
VTAEGQREEGRDGAEDGRGTAGVIAPPPLIFLAFLLVGFVLESALPDNNLPTGIQWLGALLIVLGIALAVAFERALSRARTPANPYKQTEALATSGPYRFTRNPAYLAMAIIYVGMALAADAPWALPLLIPALLVVQFGVIVREERYLERLFGDEYLSYKRRTRRWL